MASIKFSALVSAVKGKINGSVFSGGPSGTSIRNNKTGGGRKSVIWDKQKSIFSNIARLWRTLTNDQQDAWNIASVNFPSTNKFGDPRIPSGFEIFQKFNTNLALLNVPFISEPALPVLFPDGSVLEIDTSDVFQFVPGTFLSFYNSDRNLSDRVLSCVNLMPNTAIFSNQYLSMRVLFPQNILNGISDNTYFTLFYSEVSSTQTALIRIRFRAPQVPVLEVSIIDGATSYIKGVDIPFAYFTESMSLLFNFTNTSPKEVDIYVNGIAPAFTRSVTGVYGAATFNADTVIGFTEAPVSTPVYISDLRSGTGTLTASEILEISYGYMNKSFFCAYDFKNELDGLFKNFGTNSQESSVPLTYDNDVPVAQIPFQVPYIPLVKLTNDQIVDAGFTLRVFSSPPVSNGITSLKTRKNIVYSLPLESNQTVILSDSLKAFFKSIPFNSNLIFSYAIVSSTTGQSTSPAFAKIKQGKTRFKAGAELSSTVN
jgi:hypothetical protein